MVEFAESYMRPETNEEPPSSAKLALIRRFLVLTGVQAEIDSGSFLYAFLRPGNPVFEAAQAKKMTYGQFVVEPMKALRQAYERHRGTWQNLYEEHAHWEFDEGELSSIVSFLESPVGSHFLEGRRRMKDTVETMTQDLWKSIGNEAAATLRGIEQQPAG